MGGWVCVFFTHRCCLQVAEVAAAGVLVVSAVLPLASSRAAACDEPRLSDAAAALEAAAARGGLDDGQHRKAMAFLDRIHARPAYVRALEKGGPYQVGR